MTRKLQKAILKKEGQRRSPRISALETWQAHGSSRRGDPVLCSDTKNATASEYKKLELDNGQGQGPAFRTRGRDKRKLRPVQQVSASASLLSPPKQDGSQSDEENIQKKKSDEPSNLPSATFVPEKRMLELVLDILQRRDTYEIFAEPVDPKEVEDYYEIIEEPMDFGTMRAKLHEGMYKSLEQFELDVYLIFSNAMHFNSSGTIYFRQAYAINDLAKKVFEVLKTNPENFESEFSEKRRKVLRRNQGDFKASTNVKYSGLTNGVSSKVTVCSFHGTSNRKSFKANHGRSNVAKNVYARKLEALSGTRDSRQYGSFEADRRSTYRPSLSLGEDESIFPTVYSQLKLLEHVNQQDIGYRDSLMFFVKDLGLTAQNIARRKLLGCEIQTAATSVLWKPETLSTVIAPMPQNPLNWFSGYPNSMRSPQQRVDVEIATEGKTAYVNDDIDHARVEGTLNADKKNAHSSLRGELRGSQRMSFGCDEVYKNQSLWSHQYHSRASAEDLSCSVDASKEIGKNSMIMSLDKPKLINQVQISESAVKHSQPDVLQSRLESKCMFQSQSWALQTRDFSSSIQVKTQMEKPSFKCPGGGFETIAVQRPTDEVSCSSEAGNISKSDPTVPLASSFIFNLPYLKTRLDQIKSSEHYRLSQQDSGCTKKPFSVQAGSFDS